MLSGAVPGAAEPGAANKMGAAAAGRHLHQDPKLRSLLRVIHQQSEEETGPAEERSISNGFGTEEHARPGGRLPEQVRTPGWAILDIHSTIFPESGKLRLWTIWNVIFSQVIGKSIWHFQKFSSF